MEIKDKDMILNAKVLLISNIEEDYQEMINYGFKNIDYFRSIIRADKYFASHPEELEKYHIILRGNQNVQNNYDMGSGVYLDYKINDLKDRKDIFVKNLIRYVYPDHIKLGVCLSSDAEPIENWTKRELTYNAILDRIVEYILDNNILNLDSLKNNIFTKYVDYVNPNRLALPTKKSELKILYVGTSFGNIHSDEISKSLKLNITFKDEDIRVLGNIKSHLGDYDIIIADHPYCYSLLGMNYESTEQCKDTGRDLTLLITYKYISEELRKSIGCKLNLKYVFGGNLAPDLDIHEKKFGVLRQQIEVTDEYWAKLEQSAYSATRGIIEASVNLYNQTLAQINNPILEDFDLRTLKEINQEYMIEYVKEKEIEELEIAPIRAFDEIRFTVINYLNNRNNGLITIEPKDLRITESGEFIKVENIYEERVLCSIIFRRYYIQENLRIFDIQTTTKKGTLSAPQTIGLYTSEYEKNQRVPRPDEKQSNVLISIQKKVNYVLTPLNDEVYCESNTPKKLVLDRKKNPVS